jgi:3-hydroxy-9,10-secoandrosta-1,3,5(10)-triene-9,17-dione monooxygenase
MMTEPSQARLELLTKARALESCLRDRVAEAERLRRLPDATLRDFHEAGLFRVLQPRRVGGAELDYGVLVDLGAAIAHGCASSAWTLTALASHHWMLAKFPPAAQEQVWGADPNALIAASYLFPAGSAQPVAGGYRLSGRWLRVTGADLCGWSILGALVGGEGWDEPSEYRLFLVPAKDYRVIDNWQPGGLDAISANDIELEDVFVASDCTLATDDTKGGETPGSVVNPSPLYRIPVFAMFPYVRSGTALGLAERTLAIFTDSSSHRATTYTGVPLRDRQAVHIRLGEASTLVDAARLLMTHNCAQAQSLAEQDRVPEMLDKVRYRRDGAHSVSFCARAVDILYEAGGGGVAYLHSGLQRAFRDIHGVRAYTASADAAGSDYGRVAFGQSADNPTV